MKKSIKIIMFLWFAFALLPCRQLLALTLTPLEVEQMNLMAEYFDHRPEGTDLRELEAAIKSENPAVRGVAAVVLFKYYGNRFKGLLLRSYTLNQEVDAFKREKPVLVKLQAINKLIDSLSRSVNLLKDERLQRLFLFFHLRHKNVWMVGASAERLSMAVFYRISTFDELLGAKYEAIRLAALADRKQIK